MSSIRILPDHLVNQIAAGEVIERPAAALKELAENALDAGATQVDVTLRSGGKSYIAVVDNGCGMARGDLALALTRHATSKLPDDDLVHIRTMGFRGEALPSIGSVARLSLTSRPKDSPEAWRMNVEGGTILETAPAAHPSGTRVEIRDLFFATPARLKFLKGDLAEFSACKDVIIRLAIARPDVGFTLTHNDQKSFILPRLDDTDPDAALSQRLQDILGRDFGDHTLALDAQSGAVSLKGRIGYPTYNRGQANQQYLFVSNRPVRDRLLLSALRVAYGDLMPRDRHAVAALFINLPPDDVDVNVHPGKAEVRFRDAGAMRSLVISAIRQRLSTLSGAAHGSMADLSAQQLTAGSAARAPFYAPAASYAHTRGNGAMPALRESAILAYDPLFAAPPAARALPREVLPNDSSHYPLGAAIAQIHNTYIVAQTEDGVILVDQHAAHERLVYERYKQQRRGGRIPCQQLLSPEVVPLDDVRAGVLLESQDDLAAFGLEIEPFGPDCLLVRGVPAELSGRLDLAQLITDLADEILEKGAAQTLEDRILYFLATCACHHSVRAGRALSIPEMNALLRQIEETPNAGTCNHGRPSFIRLSRAELEKLFERR